MNRNTVPTLVSSDGLLELRSLPDGDGVEFWQAGTRLPWRVMLDRVARLGVREGTAVTQHPVRLSALHECRVSSACVRWQGEIAGAGVALEISLEDGGVVFRVSPLSTGQNTLVSAVWPGRVLFDTPDREVVWPGDGADGQLFRADGRPWTATLYGCYTTLRLAGFTGGGRSLGMIIDTCYDAVSTLSDDGRTMCGETEFQPSLGELAYARAVRFVPAPEPGLVAVASVFRAYAQRNGLWKSWQERVAERPAVEKLKGAFINSAGYLQDDAADIAGAMRRMKDFGFERGYLFTPRCLTFDDAGWSHAMGGALNRMTGEHLEKIQGLGYLCAPFLQVEEASTAIGEHNLVRRQDGSFVHQWSIDDTRFYEIAKWRSLAWLPRLDPELEPCHAVHFDTVASAGLLEDWNPPRYRRADDVRLRLELLDYHRRRGRVVASENLRDWASPLQDFGTTRSFPSTGDDRHRYVPLCDLVYHDSLIRSHWEFLAFNDNHYCREADSQGHWPRGLILSDYLTASPPVLFLEGKMYGYACREETGPDGATRLVRDGSRREIYTKRFADPGLQAVLPEALKICRLNLRHGTARMVDFRYPDPGNRYVQESAFSTGLHVVVNYGDEPYTLADGRTIAPRGVLVEE